MPRRGDRLKEGDLWRRDCAEIISLIGDDLPLGTTIAAGTYTPTLTIVANADAVTAFSCIYTRIGTIVNVMGVLNVDPTTGATITQVGISLPVSSNFASTADLSGVAAALAVAGESGGFFADTTNDRANLHFVCASTANHAIEFNFSYRII